MPDSTRRSAAEIRTARAESPNRMDRDFAHELGITEAELVAAFIGHGVTRLTPSPDEIIPRIEALGEVLALTRNESCVNERVGLYDSYHSGKMASMVVSPEIDLRIFPNFWAYAFAVEKETQKGLKRSIQIFSPWGEAMHKIHLRETSNLDAWASVVETLRLEDQSGELEISEAPAPEAPKSDPEKRDALRAEWDKMSDTHQFMRLTSKLKMNRLGAYRIVGGDYAIPMHNKATEKALYLASEREIEIMVFVGNRGCIQIHGGPVKRIVEMGPWINVLDERFDLHLRNDHIAETYLVTKPTQRGPAVSLECFDAEGRVIAQIFPHRRAGDHHADAWDQLVAELPRLGDQIEKNSKAPEEERAQ